MPLYVYRCTACRHALEALQRIADEPLRVCPSCQEFNQRKQVTGMGQVLKGAGWYQSDFGGKRAR